MIRQEKNKSYDIAFADFDFESHVKSAFQAAVEFAGDQPIAASDLLRAVHAVILYGSSTSVAFRQFVSMLPLKDVPKAMFDRSDAKFHLSRGLAESYSVAKKYFSKGKSIWGRDLITFVLLADHDPSLNEIVNEAGITVDGLQEEWYNFITSSTSHRPSDEWKRWWEEAGVTVPSEGTGVGGATYLFTWNPNRYDASKIEKHVKELGEAGSTIMQWSTGSRRHVSSGDQVLLIRQGAEPLGLVGYGQIEGDVKEVPHWDVEERKKNKMSWIVPVRWQKLSTMPIVSREELIRETEEQGLWNVQAGGVKVKPHVVDIIKKLIESSQENGPIRDIIHYAKTLSDLDHENDWIGIRTDVEALSTLVSVNRVEPPLSIAIFGDWGSGKTFLMRKIQERVQILEDIAKKKEAAETGDTDQPRYCSSILQIEFNSWHYTESNLWASLVNHIFEKLHDKFYPEDRKKKQVKNVDKFFEVFETARIAREAAEQKIQLVSAEVDLADKEVDKVEKDVGNAKRRLTTALGRSVWDHLDEKLKTKDGKWNSQTVELNTALRQFGFEKPLESAQTICDTIERFRSVSGRAREVLGTLLTTQTGMAGAIILAAVVVVATALAVKFNVPVLSMGTAFAGILCWLAERVGHARKWLKAVQAFDQWFSSEKQAEEGRIAKIVAGAQADLEQRKEALLVAKTQLAEAQMREVRAKEDLKNLTARDQIRRFIDARVTAQTYSKHLGLISTIRRDFEDLSDFMQTDRQPGQSDLVTRITEEVREAIPTVDRIILYIDDLDRCRPDRVVEVLEAIHLLLAFRLFVVVVAVDPRWVLESLRQRYPHLVVNEKAGNDDQGPEPPQVAGKMHQEATAHDYLEKIFNIPFWVKPMSPEAGKNLIAGYLGFSKKGDTDPEKHEEQEKERFKDLMPKQMSQQASITDTNLIIKSDTPSKKKKSVKAAVKGRQITTEASEELVKRQETERIRAEQKVENVVITANEEKFILQVAPHFGDSPRRIKRYANTYRLLKSGLTQQESRMFGASTRSTDDYKIVLVFLAVVTGAPTLAPLIFAEAFRLRDQFDIETLIKNTGIDANRAEPSEAMNAKGALELLKETQITRENIEIWIPRVMRYAFRRTPVDITATTEAAVG